MLDERRYSELMCNCKCGGVIANGVQILLSEDGTLVVMGLCNTCKKTAHVSMNIVDMVGLLSAPAKEN